MDTDNKNTDENQITGGEKDALHNAGVDLSVDVMPKEQIINIDDAPKVGEDVDLKKIGIEFTPITNKEDLSLLKEQMDKNVLAQKSSDAQVQKTASVFKEDQPKIKETVPASESIQQSSFEPKKKEADVSELEKEFNQTIGSTSVTKNESLNEKIFSLQSMLEKIKEKLGFKKKEVKQELENLKKVKEDIAKDIENIKELEESEQKIEAELEKIEKIKEEVSSIEKEVKEELNS